MPQGLFRYRLLAGNFSDRGTPAATRTVRPIFEVSRVHSRDSVSTILGTTQSQSSPRRKFQTKRSWLSLVTLVRRCSLGILTSEVRRAVGRWRYYPQSRREPGLTKKEPRVTTQTTTQRHVQKRNPRRKLLKTMVGPGGLEPLTSSVSRKRSNQLSYGPNVFKYCGLGSSSSWFLKTLRDRLGSG